MDNRESLVHKKKVEERVIKGSRGENAVRYILTHMLPNDMSFIEQYRIIFQDLTHVMDFYIEGSPGLYIEYDGEQHERAINHWDGEEGLLERQFRDREKNTYAKSQGSHLLRLNHRMTPYDMSDKIHKFLSTYTNRRLPEVTDLTNAEYYTKYDFTVNDVANYYLEHTMKECEERFPLHEATIRRYFVYIFGRDKQGYIRDSIRNACAKFYLDNPNKQTQKRFGISDATVQKYFKEVYGTDKTSYLRGYTKEEVADYYLNHSTEETAKHFNIFRTTPHTYFKEIYGTNKADYLNKLNGTTISANQNINGLVKFKAISPDGTEYISTNQTEFAKEHGLVQGNVNHCLRGRIKSTKGWRFKYID